jgi:hypothetical protein
MKISKIEIEGGEQVEGGPVQQQSNGDETAELVEDVEGRMLRDRQTDRQTEKG